MSQIWKIKFERYVETTRTTGHKENIEIELLIPNGYKFEGVTKCD